MSGRFAGACFRRSAAVLPPDHQRKDFPMNRNIRFLLTAAIVMPALIATQDAMAQGRRQPQSDPAVLQAETAQTAGDGQLLMNQYAVRQLVELEGVDVAFQRVDAQFRRGGGMG